MINVMNPKSISNIFRKYRCISTKKLNSFDQSESITPPAIRSIKPLSKFFLVLADRASD